MQLHEEHDCVALIVLMSGGPGFCGEQRVCVYVTRPDAWESEQTRERDTLTFQRQFL